MRIMLTGDLFRFAGAEVSTLDLLTELQRRHITAWLFVPQFKDEKISHEGVITFKVPWRRPTSSEEIYLKLGNPMFWFLYTRSLVQAIRWLRPSILHSSGYFSTPGTSLASRITKVPFISQVRDYRLICSAETCFKEGQINICGDYQRFRCMLSLTKSVAKSIYGVLIVWLMRYSYSRSKKIICISDFVADALMRIFDRKSLTVCYPVVSPCSIPHVAGEPKWSQYGGFHILYYGRLAASKGAHLLLDCVEKGNSNVVLHIAGEGELLDSVQDYSRNSSRIIYHGQLRREEMYKLCGSVALVVIPSLWPEPWGRTVAEPQLIGIPVIASRRGGIPEILPQHCIFEPCKDALIAKIAEVMKQPSKYLTQVDPRLATDAILVKMIQIYTDFQKRD
ncbi:glycosyltransferase [Chloroflexota bacterium]